MSKMTARSVVLSVLLGAHPASATSAELLRLTADFGIREQTLRVALTRMVAAGDLVRSDDGYRLSGRLLDRQRRQDDALDPRTRAWDGGWVTLVIMAVGMDARARAAFRNNLQSNRFGELREGLWLRPDNLDGKLPAEITGRVRVLHSRDEDPVDLARRLWGLDDWSRTGHRLLAQMAAARDIPQRFVAAAAIVRHLLTDPVLPDELLPPRWPGPELRKTYADFAAELGARRDEGRLVETI
ncbi:PaaX family transcriptional regulator C-terminal domain-containing protein [Mycolicibacterium sp. CBM1]